MLVVLLLTLSSVALGEKLFAYPGGHSHQLILSKIARELVSRGHEACISSIVSMTEFQLLLQFVYIHSSLDALNKNNWDGLTVLQYQAPMSLKEWDEIQPRIVEMNPTDGVIFIYQLQEAFCKAIMASTEIMDFVRDADGMLADAAFSCVHLVADYVKVPVRVDFCAIGVADPLNTVPYGVPSPLSYAPQMGSRLGSHLTFADRLKNTIFYFINTNIVIKQYGHTYVNNLRAEYGVGGSHAETQHRTGIVLAQSTWGLEFSHPIVPAIKVVGPILPEPGSPLPEDLEAFMQSSGDEGVILVSMGTILYLSDSIISRLKDALINLPSKYKVIWKLNMDVGSLPSNIRVLSWIPQNDLLAHPKLRAFVSHGGLNGVQEAAYHGVPMVGFPLFADQFENLLRVQERGFGIIIDRDHFNAEMLTNAVNEIVSNSKYKEAAVRVSRIVRDTRNPTKECADWFEYALAHDGALFNIVPTYSMPFWALHNLDVYLLLAIISYALLVILPRAIFRRLFKKKVDDDKKHK